jgi:hypothetical protein
MTGKKTTGRPEIADCTRQLGGSTAGTLYRKRSAALMVYQLDKNAFPHRAWRHDTVSSYFAMRVVTSQLQVTRATAMYVGFATRIFPDCHRSSGSMNT